MWALLLALQLGLGQRSGEMTGVSVRGTVVDSLSGRPLAHASVQIVGAESARRFAATVVADSLGRFVFDSVPDGQYRLGFYHPLLDSLGLELPVRNVQVRGRAPVQADLAIPSPARIGKMLCGGPARGPSIPVLVGVLRDARTQAPVGGGTVLSRWTELVVGRRRVGQRVPQLTVTTPDDGWFVLCGVPSPGILTIAASRGSDSTGTLKVQMPNGGFLRLDLWLGRLNRIGLSSELSDAALRAHVDSATRAFMLDWRYAWKASERDTASASIGEASTESRLRLLALHCHYVEASQRIAPRMVRGATVAHASCPIWYPEDGVRLEDERVYLDGALDKRLRPMIIARRNELQALLDTAAYRFPDDLALARQRVRFALDGGDVARATELAAACTHDAAQCGLLRALAMHRAGQVAGADAAFLAAAALMPADERCRWNDIEVLLDPEARREYAALSCSARTEFEERFWWLADPLFHEQGNERRAEHFARKTMLALRAALDWDERQDWRPTKGGEGAAEVMVRYGWPAHLWWAGQRQDDGHSAWLVQHKADSAAPYFVREYTRGRLHTAPSARLLRAPFDATPDAWNLNAPLGDDTWWPEEHYARDRSGIVELPAGQSVMLRRWSASRFAWATELAPKRLARRPGEAVRAAFFAMRGPSSDAAVGAFPGHVGKTLVVDAAVRAGPALIGIEIPGDSARPAARTRFGVTVEPPLASMAQGVAMSQPLLVESNVANGALEADGAVQSMYGTTTLVQPRRIGVYWEAYGFAATDAVDIEVRMVREDRPGLLVAIAGLFRIGRQEGGRVGIRWHEASRGGRYVQRLEGTVPVQMRSISVDVSRLERGHYRLQLSMERPGAPAVMGERAFVIQ